ncbi:sensor histidine kinase [Ktedonobacter racemifer]|uniref:histidine kinase n=1 Tax=Ktedonobacter racemifer DSM 44963 TaxID=485913 RepID=D6TF38_KTERA|nr:HAMP domain-containing sensor histidine kinase [Ktedonobacter racemifer]EFH90438.1 integral membrane sensor signal transduction histidine kinase [Ktedonobacter racemifer DSM 44963]
MTQKRMRWWQSIRWRLALGSVGVMILAMILLVATAILAILYYYDSDQKTQLNELSETRAQQIGREYSHQLSIGEASAAALQKASVMTLPVAPLKNLQDQTFVNVVLGANNRIAYPTQSKVSSKQLMRTAQIRAIYAFITKYLDPSQKGSDITQFRNDLAQAQNGDTVTDTLGNKLLPQSFIMRPIFTDGDSHHEVVGVLFVAPRSTVERSLPQYISNVGSVVLLALVVVALLAALGAILFARTITRPLEKMTVATRQMAVGDYNVRVQGQAMGELGELATTFNEMASQLHQDVEALREQELWRRELIMNITHDLATPLTAIAGLGEAMVDGINQTREDYEATGRIIVRETLRLRRLVKDLHVMAKVEAGALHPQRTSLRMAALVDEAIAVLAPEFERADVEPLNNISFELPQVEADADMITRVVSNLCDNALQHTPSGGQVVVDAQVQGAELLISVTDTGKGIPSELLARIFERFYRIDGSRQAQGGGGSGLGLSIVRAIVEAHGGRVWAENAPGMGARIIFTLPLVAAGQPSFADATTQPLQKIGLLATSQPGGSPSSSKN